MTDCVLALSELNSVWMISSYGDRQSTTGNNPSYYYRASPTLPLAPECFQEHLMFYTCNYNIRVTHRNGAIKHIFYESDPRRDHRQIVLYSFCRSCNNSSSYDLNINNLFYVNLSTLAYHICRFVFPSEYLTGPHFVTQPILLSENIPNIWHKSSTNTRRSDQIETIKTIMQTTALVSHGRFYQWGSGCHF